MIIQLNGETPTLMSMEGDDNRLGFVGFASAMLARRLAKRFGKKIAKRIGKSIAKRRFEKWQKRRGLI